MYTLSSPYIGGTPGIWAADCALRGRLHQLRVLGVRVLGLRVSSLGF